MHLRSKYGHEVFDMEGIGKQTDMSTFSKNFFNSKTTVADISVDSNSNVDDMSVIAYNVELPKPFFRLNSLFLTWKYLKQLYGHPIANKAIEMQISGDIYINDFSGINFPYSYFEKTVITVNEDGNIIYTTMKELFERYSKTNNVVVSEDKEVINLVGIKILDKNNKWVNLECILKHKSHTNLVKIETKNGFSTVVTTDHPVILEDGSEKYAKDLSINDSLMVSNTYVPLIESKIVDDDYAYMVGFMIGDGWIYKSKGVNADIISGNITIRQNDIQATKIYKVVSSLYSNVKSYEKDKITFGYKKDVLDLLDTGIGSINRKLPVDILHWNKSAIKSLLSGIVDSDGNVNGQNGIITIRVISYEMVQQVGELLRALGVGCVRTSFAGVYNSVGGFKSDNDVFRVSIRLKDKDFINYSEKIDQNKDLVYKEMKSKDGRYETSKINKLEQWITPEYVYDVTTETGHFHCQGLIQHNCYNFSSYDVMTLGLPFVKKVSSEPAKHLSSFMGQLIHFSVYASNSVLGAVGLADVLIVASYYVDKLFIDNPNITPEYLWKQVKQELQSFVFSCNQPFRGGVQSGFYNISIFDEEFLAKMCSEYIFPDGSVPNIDTINTLQEIYINLMNETLRTTPITFPVTTACFTVDENKNIKDSKFLNFIAKNNLEFGFINLYFGETSTLSSCCFLGNQKTLTKSSEGINYMSFQELKDATWDTTKKNFTIFHNGSWTKGKVVKVPKDNKIIYKITTSNNKEMLLTEDHINVSLNGDVKTDKLTTNDYLLFNALPLSTFPERDLKRTYEQGVLIGAYLGDGSIYIKENASCVVNYSLNEDKYKNLFPLIKKAMKQLDITEEIHLQKERYNVYPVVIYSDKLNNFIRKYVKGDYSQEKELNLDCLLQSQEFRQGIVDGMYMTDGGNSNRIYTTSSLLTEQFEVLFTSLGIQTIINISDRTDEKVIIRGEEFNRNYPLYCIRWYDMKNKRSMKDVYVVKNNSIYFKIKSIEKVNTDAQDVYCFEMTNEDEQYFTLPNGIITHNCRLRSSVKNEYFNQFGAGGTKIGSLGVVTMNIPRMAINAKKDKNKFIEILTEVSEMVVRINNTKRNLLKKRILTDSLPLYKLGFMSLETQYCTTGVVGLNEACEIMGYNILQEDGQEFVTSILNTINSINDKAAKRYNAPFNMEQTPSENSAIKMANKDKLLGLQDEYELYSNQFIPLTVNADLLDRIKLQGLFDSKMSGGAICHLNIESRIEDEKLIENLITVSAKAGVVYTAINYNLQRCIDGHMTVGKDDKCSICGREITDNYSRVVGFLVNTKNFHKVRRTIDYPNRVFYKELENVEI